MDYGYDLRILGDQLNWHHLLTEMIGKETQAQRQIEQELLGQIDYAIVRPEPEEE